MIRFGISVEFACNQCELLLSAVPYKLVKLANGVQSVHSLEHRETFHPVIGPVAEAEALYVRQLDLVARRQTEPGEFVLWDVGLGAAANALTVLRAIRHLPGTISLHSFDRTLAPLQFALDHASELGYVSPYEERIRTLLAQQRVEFVDDAQTVHWQVHLAEFPKYIASAEAEFLPKPHGILFDAFSPARNPEMWTHGVFRRMHQLLDPARPCALPTYSRSTMLRVTLLLAGFFVGVGHATGEKEETTIAANRPELIREPLDKTWLARARNSTSAEPMWEPIYRQAPLTESTWTQLLHHAQFG